MTDDDVTPDTGACSWQPWPGRRWCYAGGAAVVSLLAVESARGALPVGTGLGFGVVAAVLAVLAVLDFTYGVPLRADADGLRLGQGWGRGTTIPWPAIDRIEAAAASSRGLLRLTSLEIDVGEQLMVVSRHRLGTDPQDVAEQLRRRWRRSLPPPRP